MFVSHWSSTTCFVKCCLCYSNILILSIKWIKSFRNILLHEKNNIKKYTKLKQKQYTDSALILHNDRKKTEICQIHKWKKSTNMSTYFFDISIIETHILEGKAKGIKRMDGIYVKGLCRESCWDSCTENKLEFHVKSFESHIIKYFSHNFLSILIYELNNF